MRVSFALALRRRSASAASLSASATSSPALLISGLIDIQARVIGHEHLSPLTARAARTRAYHPSSRS